MLTDLSPLLITVLAFIAVASAVFVIGQLVAVQMRVRQRVAAQGSGVAAAPGLAASFDTLVSSFFDEKRFGVEGSVRAKLRRELVRAGFFRVDAINYYIFFSAGYCHRPTHRGLRDGRPLPWRQRLVHQARAGGFRYVPRRA